MAALNNSVPPRKRIATYGKAVRKRPPDHIAFMAFQDLERLPGVPKAPAALSTSTESGITDSSLLSSSTTSTRYRTFDGPSSDADTASTTPKKRKLVHVAPRMAGSPVNGAQESKNTIIHYSSNECIRWGAASGDMACDASVDYKCDPKMIPNQLEKVHPGLDRSKTPEFERPSNLITTSISRTPQKDKEIWAGLSPRHSQHHSALSSHPKLNQGSIISSHISKGQVGAIKSPEKLQPATNGKQPSTPGTPNAIDPQTRDAKIAQSASSILTPKGAKMWNDLLGEGNEESEVEKSEQAAENMHYRVNRHQKSRRERKLPRRRLIDTLVEQSKNSKPMLDSYPELENMNFMDLDSAPPSQYAGKEERLFTQWADVPKAPEKFNNLNKADGLGQGSQSLGAKITYSRQRSMLAEQDPAKETSFDVPLDEGLSFAKLQSRRGSIPVLAPLHALHENPDAEDGNVGVAIRTIHELRQAGAESRFKDEVEDVLDRIGTPAPQNKTRRSGLMELAERLRDKIFYAKFISNGLDQRLFLHLGQEQDVISGFILILILIPVLASGITPIIVTQLRRQGITRLLIRLMGVNDSILAISKARNNNMSKLAQASIMEQHEAFLQLRVWGDLQPQAISPRTASLRCLELMVRQSREAGDTGDIISKELVSNIFTVLKDSYNEKSTTAEAIDFQLALSTLVSHSLNLMTGIEEFLPIIRNILVATMQDPSESPTVTLLLRLVLNTTNNSPAASDAFASPELLHLMCHAVTEKFRLLSGFIVEEERLVLVDSLVLILVVMINIAELSILARQCFLEIQDTSLADLVTIFQDNIERAFEADSVEDSHLNVAGGYLAVLLGCLSLSPEIREQIRIRQRAAFLQPLIACIEEFVSHHKKVDALLKDEGEHNPQAGLTNRLQKLLDKLKEMSIA